VKRLLRADEHTRGPLSFKQILHKHSRPFSDCRSSSWIISCPTTFAPPPHFASRVPVTFPGRCSLSAVILPHGSYREFLARVAVAGPHSRLQSSKFSRFFFQLCKFPFQIRQLRFTFGEQFETFPTSRFTDSFASVSPRFSCSATSICCLSPAISPAAARLLGPRPQLLTARDCFPIADPQDGRPTAQQPLISATPAVCRSLATAIPPRAPARKCRPRAAVTGPPSPLSVFETLTATSGPTSSLRLSEQIQGIQILPGR
jgi:hypothetical protein